MQSRENLSPRRRRSYMDNVVINAVLDKLPTSELDETLSEFVAPFAQVLPDERLRRVVPLAVRGIVAGKTPVVTAMARSVESAPKAPPGPQLSAFTVFLRTGAFRHDCLRKGSMGVHPGDHR